MSTDLLSTTEAAAIVGVTTRTLTRMANAGHIGYAMKQPGRNGALVWERSEVERVAAARNAQVSA